MNEVQEDKSALILPEKIIKTGSFKGRYFGEEFIKTEFEGSAPIINGWLWERDTIIILGKEKCGKSLLSQFMALHLTCGQDWLGEYKVTEPTNVIYLQAEGKISQTQQNIKRMMKVVPADMRRFMMLYYPAIALNTQQGFEEIYKQIKTWEPIKAKNTVIFGDSLYRMMKGSMKDDEQSNNFIDHARLLADEFGLTWVIMTHAHREKYNLQTMEKIFEGDDAIFGSFVWKAFVEHVLLIQKKENTATVSCNTQRTGSVVEDAKLILNEPDPLFFNIKENIKDCDDIIFNALKIAGKASRRDLEIKTGYGKTTVHNGLNRLLIIKRVDRVKEPDGSFSWITI